MLHIDVRKEQNPTREQLLSKGKSLKNPNSLQHLTNKCNKNGVDIAFFPGLSNFGKIKCNNAQNQSRRPSEIIA